MDNTCLYQQPSLFPAEETGGVSLEEVFEAYFDCRRKKRNTYNALAFESDYERKCIDLWHEINSGTYHPSRSIAFIVTKPVKREVFAADFRDRVVHHLIARKIVPILEAQFINGSYSTRKGKGTLYGIQQMEQHIRACSENYTADCHILKIDIRSFFMDIPKQGLYDRTERLLKERYRYIDCDNAVCRNSRKMNIHIVKGLPNDCAHLVESLFTAAPFSFEECMELKR